MTSGSQAVPVYDTIDNDSNGEDDRCNKEMESLGVPVDSGKHIFLGYWDAAYSSSGATPVGTFVFDRAVTQMLLGDGLVMMKYTFYIYRRRVFDCLG